MGDDLLQIKQLGQRVGVAEGLLVPGTVKSGLGATVHGGPGVYLAATAGDEARQAGGESGLQQAEHGLGAQLRRLLHPEMVAPQLLFDQSLVLVASAEDPQRFLSWV